MAAALAFMAAVRSGRGPELASATSALALAGVSLLSSWGRWVLVADVALAAALYPLLAASVRVALGFLGRFAFQANRQAGHVEPLLLWLTIAIVAIPWFTLKVAAGAALVAFGPALVDLAGWSIPVAGRRARGRAELHWNRRVALYALTVAGEAVLVALSPGQARQLSYLLAALLSGTVLRAVWLALASRLGLRSAFHVGPRAARFDRAALGAALGLAVLLPLVGMASGSGEARADRLARSRCWRHCEDGGAERPPDAELFIVSDAQLHALDGERSAFQLGLVDSVVPVAVRPVELDLLSGVTLRHFAARFRDARRARAGELRWAYLGDLGDLGCVSELDRFDRVVSAFGRDALAAVIPGNHDDTFLGNVFWHPAWDRACPGGRATRPEARRQLLGAAGEKARAEASPGPFLAAVTRLGTSAGRFVLGVFFDTTDFGNASLGIAGVQGAVSQEQVDWVKGALGRGGPDAWVVLFMHHPVAELSPSARRALGGFVAGLNGRLIGVVSAHTHLAGRRRSEIGGLVVPELVVGSTTDPPQEASLLQIVPGSDGRPRMALRTLAAVERRDLTCGEDAALDDVECREIVRGLRKRPACAELFEGGDLSRWAAAPAPAQARGRCAEAVRRFWPTLERGDQEIGTPEELDCVQQARAWRLLKCIEDDEMGSRTPRFPLDERNVFEQLEASTLPGEDVGGVADEGPRRRALVCLSWIASVVQGHKPDWRFAQATALAFERDAAFGELRVAGVAAPLACVADPLAPRGATGAEAGGSRPGREP